MVKGGCLLLGVGFIVDGVIEEEVIKCLYEVGKWLCFNGKVIYNICIILVYWDGNVWFIVDKDGKILYVIYVLFEGEKLLEVIEWKGNLFKGNMKLLKGNKCVKYVLKGDKVEVILFKGIENELIVLLFVLKK